MPLSIFQGNDKAFKFIRRDLNGKIISTVPQGMWFTVKSSFENKSFVFQKSLNNGISQNSDGSWTVSINAEDTAELTTGKYYCDVKIRDEQGREITIVKPQIFAVEDVATMLINEGV